MANCNFCTKSNCCPELDDCVHGTKTIEFYEVQAASYRIKLSALKKHLREANRGAERLSMAAQLLAERMANQMRLRDDRIAELVKERDHCRELLKK